MATRTSSASLSMDQDQISLLALSWDQSAGSVTFSVSLWLAAGLGIGLVVAVAIALVYRWWNGGFPWKDFEIDRAELGIGQGKVHFKPNAADRQVAYALWVELSTRKIGLPIDFEHDVIVEVYNSWYEFFSVTREVIKGIPVSRVRNASTQKIIQLSIEVLNDGLRPHLTQWQARFRRWYDRELKADELKSGDNVTASHPDPQEIQRKFPRYAELRADMEKVNAGLIAYRSGMYELVMMDGPH